MKIKSFMKVLNVGKYAAMAALLMGTMVACSDDDDDDNGGGNNSQFETPKYEGEAARLVIDDQRTSPYKSIELTASGNFIIQPSEYVNNAPQKVPVASKKNMLQRLAGMMNAHISMPETRYEVYSLIAYGKYTKTGENHYNLEGFGTLTINKDANGTVRSIVLTTAGKHPEEYTAHRQNTNINSDMSNKLCRTWCIESYRYYAKINGKTYVDLAADTFAEMITKMYNWSKKNDPDFDESEWDDMEDMKNDPTPENVIFTKTGTYIVLYSNKQLAVSTWIWQDEKNGILRYSWNPDNFNDYDEAGDVKIEFKNNRLHLTEGDFDYEDGESYEEGLTYIMTEVK